MRELDDAATKIMRCVLGCGNDREALAAEILGSIVGPSLAHYARRYSGISLDAQCYGAIFSSRARSAQFHRAAK